MGHVSDDVRLALIYSAADAFVFPSHEDNAPLTIGEALLCGTPVVAFPVGNVPDLVRHRDTGYVAGHLDIEDLVAGIRWALEASPTEALSRSLRCRTSAAAAHDPETAATRHEALYRAVMGQAPNP
jgi:glycosyltransferase involved in cell wall biosynthesis